MEDLFEKARLEYFFKMSLNRFRRRKMARELKMMRTGWGKIKDNFPPYNLPIDMGIHKYKI